MQDNRLQEGSEPEPDVTDKLLAKPDVITNEKELNKITTITIVPKTTEEVKPGQGGENKNKKSHECHDCTECHEGHCCFPFCYCICCGWCDELECCSGNKKLEDQDEQDDEGGLEIEPKTVLPFPQNIIPAIRWLFWPPTTTTTTTTTSSTTVTTITASSQN